MTKAVPVKDTKDTAAFSRLVHSSNEAVLVTKNGREDYVALTVEEYDTLRYKAAMADLYGKLLVSEREGVEGKTTSYGDFREEVRSRYGI